jgi:uncharacterized protein
MTNRTRRFMISGAVILVLWVGWNVWKSLMPDYWWFQALASASDADYVAVFRTMLGTRVIIGVLMTALLLTVSLVNVWLLHRFSPPVIHEAVQSAVPWQVSEDDLRGFLKRILYGGSALISVALGLSASAQWEVVQRWLNADGIQFTNDAGAPMLDPIFGKNVAFYMLEFPAVQVLSGWLLAMSLPLSVLMAAMYFFYGGLVNSQGRVTISRRVGMHLGILVGLTFVALAFKHWLSRYDLLYVEHANFYGAGYVEVKAKLPALLVLVGVCVVAAVVWFVGVMTNRLKLAVYVTVAYFAVLIIGGGVYPSMLAQIRVKPNEQELQREFIRNNIQMTRHAYGLDKIKTEEYRPSTAALDTEAAMAPAILDNVRLWDPRPLKDVYEQRQELRTQYSFAGVDIDRYEVDGIARQVSVAAREIDIRQLPHAQRGWVNVTLNMTHGYGVVMGPVNEVSDGEPTYYVKDIPLDYDAAWKHTVDDDPGPRVYYGEQTSHYVIVNPGAEQPIEFDIPQEGQGFAKYTYEGRGGVPIGSMLRRLTYMGAFSEYKILLNEDIGASSRIMYRRDILGRVQKIAPFLKYDQDPYLVVADGRLQWVVDAYMTTMRYPYSQPLEDAYRTHVREVAGRGPASRVLPRGIPWGNYLRNSVKVVVDAYDGSARFYRLDTDPTLDIQDPLLECYARIFPDLFKPFADMSPELRKHIRYPLSMFWMQAGKLLAYHMTDPDAFYVGEDLWDRTLETYEDSQIPVDPYYVTMAQPGDEGDAEFLLIYPFRPREKTVMSAWMAARCDYREDGSGLQYGQTTIYRFPKGSDMPGPSQWESQFLANPEFSEWKKLQAAEVKRGNLLLFPLTQGVLAIEPVYLRAQNTPIPAIAKVLVGYMNHTEEGGQRQTAFGDSLEDALLKLLGPAPSRATFAQDAAPGQSGAPRAALSVQAEDLVGQAQIAWDDAQDALRDADWTEYGLQWEKLGEILKLLGENESR